MVLWRLMRGLSHHRGSISGICAWMILMPSVSFGVSVDVGASSADAEALELARGRLALDKNQPTEAERSYRKIPWTSRHWPEKIRDHVRFYLSPKDSGQHLRPEQAWKLTQLLRRVRRANLDQVSYLEALSAYLGGSCPLEYAPKSDVFAELLWASTYRYADDFNQPRLHGGESFEDMADGARTDAHVAGFVPYLSDLPSAHLVKGAGCRAYRYVLNPKRAPALELEHLLNAIDHPRAAIGNAKFELKTRDLWLLEIRALLLAHRLGDHGAEIQLKRKANRLNDAELVTLPSPERRIAFNERFTVTDGTRYRKGDHEAELVVTLLKDATLEEVDWIGLLDLDSFNASERRTILRPWRERDFEHVHPYLSLKLAEAEYQLGDVEASLQDLRDGACCTTGNGSPDDAQAEEFVADLTERIFREYHYDEKILGALRGTLPPRLWHSIEERLLYDAVVAGDFKSYARLTEGFQSNDESLKPVLKALTLLQFSPFSRLWQALGKKNKYLSPAEMTLARNVAHALFTADADRREALLPFTHLIAETLLAKMSAANPELVEEQQLLIHQLDDVTKSKWSEGNAMVRSGVISAGRVTLKTSAQISNPFHLAVPTSLPKARLVLMPAGTDSAEWLLQ